MKIPFQLSLVGGMSSLLLHWLDHTILIVQCTTNGDGYCNTILSPIFLFTILIISVFSIFLASRDIVRKSHMYQSVVALVLVIPIFWMYAEVAKYFFVYLNS